MDRRRRSHRSRGGTERARGPFRRRGGGRRTRLGHAVRGRPGVADGRPRREPAKLGADAAGGRPEALRSTDVGPGGHRRNGRARAGPGCSRSRRALSGPIARRGSRGLSRDVSSAGRRGSPWRPADETTPRHKVAHTAYKTLRTRHFGLLITHTNRTFVPRHQTSNSDRRSSLAFPASRPFAIKQTSGS
ncbi:hypothetical protein FRAHR75_450052 [Frankia sp. Hr75.2]|nr:hypothetical protein FRAHR75_450052 [Frankia sp. Hr75.2]